MIRNTNNSDPDHEGPKNPDDFLKISPRSYGESDDSIADAKIKGLQLLVDWNKTPAQVLDVLEEYGVGYQAAAFQEAIDFAGHPYMNLSRRKRRRVKRKINKALKSK